MELHHRIVLAFAVGAAVLPVLGLRMHARKNLCHVGSLGCCGLAILIYVVYAWIMARQENWFALSWLAYDLRIVLPLLLTSTLIANVFCVLPRHWRERFFQIVRKTWIPVLGIVLFAAFLMSFAESRGRIYIEGTAYEYRMDQAEPIGERQVILDVTTTNEFYERKTYYRGILYVEGRGTTEINMSHYDRHYGMITETIVDREQQLGAVEQPYLIYFDPDKEQFVLLYAVYEWTKTGEGHYSGSGGFDEQTGTLLCTDAPDYRTMMARCRELGFTLNMEEYP